MKLIIGSFFATLLFFNMTKNNIADEVHLNDQVEKPVLSFGVVADVQYIDKDPEGNRFYRYSANRLREAYKSFGADSVNFVVNLGDLIDGDFSSYAPIMEIINSSGIKTYHITGNHDYAVENKLKNRLPVLAGSKRGYYSFSSGDFKFIFLNGNELSTYASGNKSTIKKAFAILETLKQDGELNSMEWNGGINPAQISWLKDQLDNAISENKKVFLFCHFPIFPENVHNLLNYKEVLQLLEKYHNIIAWFNGHNHAGNYGNFNMIHFVTFRGMVETGSENSFAVVDVYRNKIWIRGSGREKSQILAY